MEIPTPDAIHQIALDRRRDALAGAQAHRLTRSVRGRRTWAGELLAVVNILGRRRLRELPPPAAAHTTPPT